MAISINGTTITDPTILTEELLQVQSENQSIAGGLQRNRIGTKKQATLEFTYLTPGQYQTLIANFTTGSGIAYVNTLSDYSGGVFTFSGLPYITEAAYVLGASLLRPFKVRIREL